MQLAYYLYRLKKEGIEAEGELLIPKEKKRERIQLDEALTRELERAISEIQRITEQESHRKRRRRGSARNAPTLSSAGRRRKR